MAALTFDFDDSKLANGMTQLAQKMVSAVYMYAGTQAVKLEAQMKRERPWTDRTGMAKATLRSVVSRPSQTMVRITLAHGVDYGIWLELAHEKNWAIVGPTIDKEAPNVLEGLQGLLEKVKV